jgi:tetratricopeptide (TPR) repeat protein
MTIKDVVPEALSSTDAEVPPAVHDLIERGREQRLKLEVPAFEEAVPLLREAIELAPTLAPAYAELSQTYSSWGLRRETACLGFWRELRVVEFQSLYDLAYDYAEMALRLDPGLASAHRAMAAALRRGAKTDPERRAREALLAVELDPEDPEGLAERWRVLGYDPDDPVIRRVVAMEPELVAAQLDLASALSERGRYAEALTELEEALRAHPTTVQVYHDIALLLDRKGYRSQALEILGKARRLRPDDPLIKQGFALLGEVL